MNNKTVAVTSASCCRLCLLDDGIKLPIFDGEGVQRQVALKIQTCFPILIYIGDPLPKMICHKCLFKLDSAYDFRLKCLETNTILKKRLLAMTHVAEVKQYLNNLESASCLHKEVTQETVQAAMVMPVGGELKTSEPVVLDNAPFTEHKMVPVKVDSSSESVFQEIFLADCSTDGFFPEQCQDDTSQENGNNLANSPSREQTVSTAPASFDSATSGFAIKIKQEPPDETAKEGYSEGCEQAKDMVTSQLFPHHADVDPVPIIHGKVKQEKLDATDVECSKCKVVFQDKKELLKHVCTVMSQWSCQHCNKSFKSVDTLCKHKKYFCPKKRSDCVCNNCGKMFPSIFEMARHQKVHLRICVSLKEDSLYTCAVCGKKFATRSILEMHKKSHSSGNLYMNNGEEISVQPSTSARRVLLKRFKCQYCPTTCTTQQNLKLHMKSHFVVQKNVSMSEMSVGTKQSNEIDAASDATAQCSKAFICKYCEYGCDNMSTLWNHMLQEHSYDKEYTCKCGKSFRKQQAYTNHKKTHYMKIHCRVCGKQYLSRKALQQHEYNQHSIRKAVHHCRLCSESFITRSELLIHGRTHHTKGRNSPPLFKESEVKIGTHPCSLCSERFTSPVALVAHMQMHNGSGKGNRKVGSGKISKLKQGPTPQSSYGEEAKNSSSLLCKICCRQFYTKWGLKRHIKMHAAGRRVFSPCKICGKKLLSESMYKTHMATHESKPFHCSWCKKIFLSEELFKCHTCENSEKQTCSKCGTLMTQEQLLKHVCDVSVLKGLMCSVCPAVFSSIQELNSHKRVHENQLILASNKKVVKTSSGLYKCTVCGKVTETQQGAAGHSRAHFSSQPVKVYSCPFCNRKYAAESGLYTHITVEHPELPSKSQ